MHVNYMIHLLYFHVPSLCFVEELQRAFLKSILYFILKKLQGITGWHIVTACHTVFSRNCNTICYIFPMYSTWIYTYELHKSLWTFFCVFPIEMQRHYRQNYYDYLSHCNVSVYPHDLQSSYRMSKQKGVFCIFFYHVWRNTYWNV